MLLETNDERELSEVFRKLGEAYMAIEACELRITGRARGLLAACALLACELVLSQSLCSFTARFRKSARRNCSKIRRAFSFSL